MNDELKGALEVLKADLEGKSKDQVKAEIKAFEEKYNEQVNDINELKEKLKEVQAHADALDVKLQEKSAQKNDRPATFGNEFKSLVNDKFDEIKTLGRKSGSHAYELKVVGDMTLGANLTGDQPRDYNNEVVAKPGQLLNFSDLVSSINISGGTYTYPRETGSEGAIAAQTEGAAKSQIDYDITMVDVNTDFLAGFAVYSKKMANNLPFLQSFIPNALRRDYLIAENAKFSADLESAATPSTVTSGNYVERLISEISALESANHVVNGIVVNPADWWTIQVTEKSTGAGYGLPGVVTYDNGVLRINGIPVYKATWVSANEYFVGDWTRVKKVVTEGLSLEFSTEDSDNFRKNNITSRIEAQIALAVEQPASMIFGDFTATP